MGEYEPLKLLDWPCFNPNQETPLYKRRYAASSQIMHSPYTKGRAHVRASSCACAWAARARLQDQIQVILGYKLYEDGLSLSTF